MAEPAVDYNRVLGTTGPGAEYTAPPDSLVGRIRAGFGAGVRDLRKAGSALGAGANAVLHPSQSMPIDWNKDSVSPAISSAAQSVAGAEALPATQGGIRWLLDQFSGSAHAAAPPAAPATPGFGAAPAAPVPGVIPVAQWQQGFSTLPDTARPATAPAAAPAAPSAAPAWAQPDKAVSVRMDDRGTAINGVQGGPALGANAKPAVAAPLADPGYGALAHSGAPVVLNGAASFAGATAGLGANYYAQRHGLLQGKLDAEKAKINYDWLSKQPEMAKNTAEAATTAGLYEQYRRAAAAGASPGALAAILGKHPEPQETWSAPLGAQPMSPADPKNPVVNLVGNHSGRVVATPASVAPASRQRISISAAREQARKNPQYRYTNDDQLRRDMIATGKYDIAD